LTRREVENFRRAFQSDLKSGCFYFPVQDSLEVLKRAISISNQYTAKVGSRTLDILHIAFAVETACTTLNTFDSCQTELASTLNNKVSPPRSAHAKLFHRFTDPSLSFSSSLLRFLRYVRTTDDTDGHR